MKSHKIKNIEKNVCTCEEKIAYDLAFRGEISCGDKLRKKIVENNLFESEISDFIFELRDSLLRTWINNGNKKYNIDGIQEALNIGLQDYLIHPFIASDYKIIGKCFSRRFCSSNQWAYYYKDRKDGSVLLIDESFTYAKPSMENWVKQLNKQTELMKQYKTNTDRINIIEIGHDDYMKYFMNQF